MLQSKINSLLALIVTYPSTNMQKTLMQSQAKTYQKHLTASGCVNKLISKRKENQWR